MYFYLYLISNLLFRDLRGSLTFLILLSAFLSFNYFSYFELIGGVSNFFYLFNFKILNIVSNIDTNIILLSLLTLFLFGVNFKKNQLTLVVVFLIFFFEVSFKKSIILDQSIFSPNNLNLLNGLFIIHPILLIILLVYLTQYMYMRYRSITTHTLNLKTSLLSNRYSNFYLNIVLFMSLFLLITGG